MFSASIRDLKPENILLDYTGHIALCDFGAQIQPFWLTAPDPSFTGLCKLNMSESEKTNSQ
jgi:serum/glucocorticoid-regulated kinase 2